MPSFDRPRDRVVSPSAWIRRFAALIRPGGRVLDVACGDGRHARWLLEHGFRVVAADIDVSGLADIHDQPGIEIVGADLEDYPWPFAERSFEGIVVTNYLHRPHFPHYARGLATGGVLLIETFAAGNERLGRPRNPAFLLEPGELLAAFESTLQIVAYEHGEEREPRPAVRERLCAVNAEGSVALPGLVGAVGAA